MYSIGGTPMNPSVVRVIAGSRLSLEGGTFRAARDERLTVALCERGTIVATSPGIIALACPVFGGADVMTDEWNTQLRKADIFVGDGQARHDIAVSARGACIVIAGTPAAWSALGRTGGPGTSLTAVLFPAIHRSRPALCRRLLRLTRSCLADARVVGGKPFAYELTSLVDDLQAGFAAMIARCPGSCLSRKKAVFLRLQRVRNHISACAHQDLDVARLALMANYSVGHFITTFRSVFDETPYSNLSRYRLESASTLLSASKLGIADIAQAIGFQSRSSFTRAIKKHLGSSASQFRESLGAFPRRDATDAIAQGYISEIRQTHRRAEFANEQEPE
jgi:AraC family transcriptional regulator